MRLASRLCLLCLGLLVPVLSTAQPAVEVCGQPDFLFGGVGQPEVAVALLVVPGQGTIADVEVELDALHTSIDQIEVDLVSPQGLVVRLHDRQSLGFSDNNIILSYNDQGVANGAQPYDGGCQMQPSGDGAGGAQDALSAFAGGDWGGIWTLVIRDTVSPGGIGQFREWCLRFYDVAAPPVAFGPIDLDWTPNFPFYDLTWTNTALYDAIEVTVDGTMVATLPGSTTSYSLASADALSHEVCVRALVAGVVLCREACAWVAPGVPDLSSCETPGTMVDDTTLTATQLIAADFAVGDVRVPVRLQHSDPSEVQLALASPMGTRVVLHDISFAARADLDLAFWDLGIEVNVLGDCGCFVVPDGPGRLADFLGESTLGNWELEVVESDPSASAVLTEWCLDFFMDSPPFAVQALQCQPGSVIGTIDVSWNNPVPYDELEIFVDGVSAGMVAGTVSSFTTMPVAMAGPFEVCVRPSVGGYPGARACCDGTIDLEEPLALVCIAEPGTGVVEVEWVSPVFYDSIFVSVNGTPEAVLVGGATSYTTQAQAFGSVLDVCVRGSVQGVITEATCCTSVLLPPTEFDVRACSTQSQPVGDGSLSVVDTIRVGALTDIELLEVDVAVRYPAISLVEVDLESPSGTVVRLHNQSGSGSRLQLTYSDLGVPNGDTGYQCQCRMQPSGDDMGPLADTLDVFVGEPATGDWLLTVATSFPLDGNLSSWCLRFDGDCQVLPPSDLTCARSGSDVELTWSNSALYTQIDVLRGGEVVANLPGTSTSYTESLPLGVHEYTVVGVEGGCGHPAVSCTSASGITDGIYRGESPLGRVDSVFELEQRLLALGNTVAVIDSLDEESLAVFSGSLSRLWVMLGTFPHNHRLSQDEGRLLAELNTGDIGLDGTEDQPPLAIYIEGNDVWGFDPPTLFADYDGVENGTAQRGDDSLVQLQGQSTGLALDLSGINGGYFHDHVGDERTDRLRPTGQTPGVPLDLGGPLAAVAWSSGPAGYDVGLYYQSAFAPVIAQSFELGGYSAILVTVVSRYVAALAAGGQDPFLRGDVDRSGAVQLNDAVVFLGFLFGGGPSLLCEDAADINDDGSINLGDGIGLLNHLFLPGAVPPVPPGPASCGGDPTLDSLAPCEFPSQSCL